MYDLKTKPTDSSVTAFLNKIEDETKKNDCYKIAEILKEITGYESKMWGTAIVGFGSYHYKYASGHEGDMCMIGFSPRKANITIYLFAYAVQNEEFTKGLGKYKTGKGCLYINKLSDIDLDVFKNMVLKSIEKTKEHYQIT